MTDQTTEPMPCPSCGAVTCPTWSSAVVADAFSASGMTARCCGSCSGSHESDTYARYYPSKENHR